MNIIDSIRMANLLGEARHALEANDVARVRALLEEAHRLLDQREGGGK